MGSKGIIHIVKEFGTNFFPFQTFIMLLYSLCRFNYECIPIFRHVISAPITYRSQVFLSFATLAILKFAGSRISYLIFDSFTDSGYEVSNLRIEEKQTLQPRFAYPLKSVVERTSQFPTSTDIFSALPNEHLAIDYYISTRTLIT